MKKLVIILTILSAFLIPVFAITSDEGTKLDGPKTADVEIRFDLTADGENSTWTIGFTDDISNLEKNNTVEPLQTGSVPLSLEGTRGTLGENNLYVYWIITGGQPLNITLSADKALNDVASNYMNWEIGWNSSESGSEEKPRQTLGTQSEYTENQEGVNYSHPLPVFSRSVPSGSFESGSAELSIKTQDISGVTPSSYAANLILTISPAGD